MRNGWGTTFVFHQWAIPKQLHIHLHLESKRSKRGWEDWGKTSDGGGEEWWKTEVVPQPFRIRYRSALWLRSNFLNPSEFPPCILTCSKKFLPWGWAIRWAISWDVRGIWTIGPTKCHSLSERPPDLSVPQCVTLSVWERRNNFLTQSAEVTNANAH